MADNTNGGLSPEASIGTAIAGMMTRNAQIVGEGKQRVHVLTGDVIENFLREKQGLLTAGPTSLAWLGILITLILTLNTTTPSAAFGLTADQVKFGFVLATAIAGWSALKNAWRWWRCDVSPKTLADELGNRGLAEK